MLSAHTLLVAAIFLFVLVLPMGGLILYLAWTGRPREREGEDAGEYPGTRLLPA